ncbi:hypothetical protein PHYSODRAFT_522292 [Phytophthora sojae]|uniref:Uncharacterized protein n=1 Tax=Phytophthora sojae (strain P6497) TaxID=1094619 RepID=G5A4M5_PHYSP|nr:hypothetical protein PHYSODRAFT_522292 [Phytophthora sojae]EGZ09625.1 hypothetical protein PHYSODRAFT_522292 [Phytophthora sojae]|eukprot:XP_009534486.1 hypothetical protein PHYSODRAFT_522292 [Phytophthora sojae]
MESIRSLRGFVSPRRSSVYVVNGKYVDKIKALRDGTAHLTAKRLLLCVWVSVGVVPLILQARSYAKFMAPHKITQDLVAPEGSVGNTTHLNDLCSVEGLVIAGAWWNVVPTHYYSVPAGNLCHFVVPQYNIHGAYLLGADKVSPSSTTPASCSNDSYPFHHYFYHGSIGFYAFYEEASGTYCSIDWTAYVKVNGLGTYDSNGAHLAEDTGDTTYRRSYWYGVFGAIWIAYRTLLIRRSFVSCKRFGRRSDIMQQQMRFKDALVYVQESLRLSAHGARSYHRAVILYLLVEGLMSDLFMLIAQDGFVAKIQYISLGYNLSGILSMLFEMVESMNWLREKWRCFVKRLLFNYETALVGEFCCAAAMQFYLTLLNRSSLKHTQPAAEAVSYYVWSLVGHGVIVFGIVAAILSIRAAGAIVTVKYTFGSLKLFTSPCSVDAALGVRSKMILLGGYVWENGTLCYKVETLKSFGIMSMEEEDDTQFLVLHKLHWLAFPRQDMIVIGEVHGYRVQPCIERPCVGIVSVFGTTLGGPAEASDEALIRPKPVSTRQLPYIS